MATTEQLRAKKAKTVAEMREIDAQADPETGSLTPELQAKWDALKSALATFDAAITRASDMEGLERHGAATPIGETRTTVRMAGRNTPLPAGFDGQVLTTQTGERVPVLRAKDRLADFAPAPAEDRAAIGLGQFLRALYLGPASDLERRALAESSIGTGGALVPTPLALTIIDLLRSKTVAFEAGVGTIPMDSQTLRFARQIADPVGGWRAENAPIVEGQPAFDTVTLTAKSWALLVKISRELLEDGQNTDAVLSGIFAKTAALALDRAILYGDGSNNSPVGIANTPGIQVLSLGANGAQLMNRQLLLDAVLDLEGANIEPSAMIMSPRSARAFNGLVDSLGQPLNLPPSLEDIPMLTTTSASIAETQGTASNASSILVGDFSQAYVGLRTALQVSILQERYADTGQVGFVLWMRADVLVQHTLAFVRIEGVVP